MTVFVSQWANYPVRVRVPIQAQAGDVVWTLISGSTNAMQTRLANGVLRYLYVNGTSEELPLVPPLNYWSLTPIGGIDYDYERDAFCLPPVPPPTVQLGKHNRAMVYSFRLSGQLAAIELEALSLEIVMGFLGVSLSRPNPANPGA